MRPCSACNLVHSDMVRCEVAAHFAKMALAVVDVPKSAKTGSRTGSGSDECEAGNTPVPPVSTSVSTSDRRIGDRHSPGYQRDLMQLRRALASGRAERYPRMVN